ncbi:peptidoglycan DD-metalloendopeptidase family protein [Nocardia mangyaensis]|uniref:peptidoglycan DD-metalloendopeptidase family protein n=1 Tax=Nocardia mangyaensis TaxID=2213200 RepID=UPI0014311E02|nr:peptidoglycan DD-metalloendopeptidase family protein [Nocardia mangyaensis]
MPVAATTTSPGQDQMPVIGTPIPDNLGSHHQRTTPQPDPDTTTADTDNGAGVENVLAHMLPTLSQALSGLTTPTNTSPATTPTHTNPTTTETGLSTTTVTDTTDTPVTIGLTPPADHALKILKVLAALYGAREKTPTPTTPLNPVTATTDGTSTTTAAHTRTTLFQQHAATAFTNLDNRLANYITNLAGANTVHRTQILALIRETNIALAALGPDTYTPTGQRKAHNILTRALRYAHHLVGTGHADSTHTTNHINQLTNHYLHNLTGSTAPTTHTSTSTSSPTAGGMGSGRFALPATGTFTSKFGPRWGKHHGGVDIANAIGTPILAAADGVVVAAGPASGFGQWVKIRHADGTETIYGHVDSYSVQPGQQVGAGQQIARMGNEGRSTGPHLHFEVRQNGAAVDPQPWLAQRGIRLT